MKSKNLITLAFIFLSYFGLSQNISSGEVLSVVPIGELRYSFILETGTENYYKTSLHENDRLNQGQVVELLFNQLNNSPNSIQVSAPTLTEPLFCQRLNNEELSRVITEIDYRKHVSFNDEYNVLVFETWEDVKAVELLLDEQVRNYPYNRGNEGVISQTIQSIKENGWNMSENSNDNIVSLKKFKDLLDQSHPLSTIVLIDIIELDEEEGLNPDFMRDVFISNLPFSSTIEERLIQSTIAPGIKNQILDANDNYLDYPNYAFQDFISTFPGYKSLYKKLDEEELQNLESGMDPSDPNFDNDIVILPFERLIMNNKYEVWIEGKLYKLYKECLAVAIQNSVNEAFNSLSVLNNDGSPIMPVIEEQITGIPISEMVQHIPLEYIVYDPQEYDPLGSIHDDPHYNTILQEYNIVEGCAKSNFTYSLYSGEEFTVNFNNQTNFSNLLFPESDFIQYWNFGDGTGSFQKNPSHKFPDNGTYTVSLATFLTDCGCWHVHQTTITTLPVPSKEGNPDCPFESISIDIGWNTDPLSVLVVALPNTDEAVAPNTTVVNYQWKFYTLIGTLVHQQNTTIINNTYYDFANEGEYYVEVTATWDGGCVSTSAQHLITLDDSPLPAECCDKYHKVDDNKEVTYNDKKYKLCYKDLARGTFGTSSWRKIQGYQKLYRKKPSQSFWKKYNAWHIMTLEGHYYDRYQDNCNEGHNYGPLQVSCFPQLYQQSVGSSWPFPDKFGLDKESIIITHTVFLHGEMIHDTSADGCCVCYNEWGHKLFDFTIKLGEGENCD